MFEVISLMFLALVLGFKHSYDSDHLIAVSNILRKADSVKSSIKVGLSWAAGHMLTATVITIILFAFRESFLNNVLPHFEKIAGIMLIALGIFSLRDFLSFHSHRHSHGNLAHSHTHIHTKKNKHSHSHAHMFGIGIVQGLASNDELLMLFAASLAVTSIGSLILALGMFSLGVAAGMVLFAAIFAYPLVKMHSEKAYRLVSFGTGSIGIFYGILILFAAV
ncbi:sulfite exporter TauE/SafE family protein [Candidatus Woesearchaeota archaeon]|nr:sulfite exporter TauE/SafE family protein [Candidatus Woesearchaeota archaeon]